MRHLIDLIETAQANLPTDFAILDEIRQDLMSWIGNMDASNEMFDNIYQNWPRPAESMTLMRVDTLTAEQGEEFLKNGRITIQAWPFCSFTRSEKACKGLVIERSQNDRYTVVTTLNVAPQDIVIDVNDFFEYILELAFKYPDRYDWTDTWEFRKFAHECEVIVRTKGILELIQGTSKIAEYPDDDRMPAAGELAYYPDSEDGHEIISVKKDSGNGYWIADVGTGIDERIYLDDGDWIIV